MNPPHPHQEGWHRYVDGHPGKDRQVTMSGRRGTHPAGPPGHPRTLLHLLAATIIGGIVLSSCTGTTGTTADTTSAGSSAVGGPGPASGPIDPTTTAGDNTPTGNSPPTASESASAASEPASASATAAEASRAAFITNADTVCGKAEAALAAIAAPIGPADLVDTLKAQLVVQQDTLTSLEQLSPPDADRTDITTRFLDPYRDAIARQQTLIPAIADVVASGDHVQLATMHTDYDSAAHPQSVAVFVRDYGFHTCPSFDYFRTQ